VSRRSVPSVVYHAWNASWRPTPSDLSNMPTLLMSEQPVRHTFEEQRKCVASSILLTSINLNDVRGSEPTFREDLDTLADGG